MTCFADSSASQSFRGEIANRNFLLAIIKVIVYTSNAISLYIRALPNLSVV